MNKKLFLLTIQRELTQLLTVVEVQSGWMTYLLIIQSGSSFPKELGPSIHEGLCFDPGSCRQYFCTTKSYFTISIFISPSYNIY